MPAIHWIFASLLPAFYHVAATSVPAKRQEAGVKVVTETSIHTFSTTVGSAIGGGKLFTLLPSVPLAPVPTTLFVTVHTRPSPSSSTYNTPTLPIPTPSTPPATPQVGKRGLSYNDPSLTDDFSGSEVTWTYNWASDPYWGNFPPNTYNKDLIYIPMLWNDHQELTSVWASNVAKARKNYDADAVLAFNEPDLCCSSCGSTCMSPSAAAAAYRQWIQPLQNKLELGAPAVTNGVAPGMGIDWMSQFMSACSTCTIDFIPIHWYGSASDPQSFKDHVKQFYQKFNKPIWVTEFGVSDGSEDQVVAFLKVVLPWLDRQDYVHRYAYFMDRAAGAPFLLNSDNSLTSIGKLYNGR